MKKKGFTLIELVIGMLLIGIGLASIINILQYATRVTNTTKSQVVAINLAREGVETIFNIRDTNWKMFSSKKDQCWLNIVPDYNDINCEAHTSGWMNATTQYYTIKSPFNNIMFFTGENVLIPTTGALTVQENKGDDTSISPGYRMCFYQGSGTSSYRDTCNGSANGVFATQYGRYWRGIEVKGLFDKSNVAGGNAIPGCTKGNVGSCGDSSAKELRFCSRVDYDFDAARRVELCSAITNFEE